MKGKWQVQCNPINGKYFYIAYRVLNTSKPVHSGNIEQYGKYSEDKREIQKLVDELNAKEELSDAKRRLASPRQEELTHTRSVCVGVAETGGT